MVYELANVDDSKHLRIRSKVEEGGKVPTAVNIWKSANWHEREVYDMMGIEFSDHPDLRRILMWEGYPYYPLRKDFPLAGKPTDMPDVACHRSRSNGRRPLRHQFWRRPSFRASLVLKAKARESVSQRLR